MNKADEWRRTSPLAILFFLVKALQALVQNAAQAIAPMAAYAFAWDGSITDMVVVGVTAVFALVIGYSVLRYLFFRFRIADDTVLIRDGVFRKKQIDIRFERIQGINIEQSLVYRWFDLVDVDFETAGSKGSEGSLPAIKQDFAAELRTIIRGSPARETQAGDDRDSTDDAPLLRLGNADMVRIGLSDRRALVVLAVLGPLLQQAEEEIFDFFLAYGTSALARFEEISGANGALAAVLLGLLALALLALGSIGAAFWRYHGFELYLSGSTLHSSGGLTTNHQVSTSIDKVQRLRLAQGVILRLFRRYRLSAYQATSSENEKTSFTVPLIERAAAEDLARRLFAPEAPALSLNPDDARFSSVHIRYVFAWTLMIGLLPALLAGTGLWFAVGAWAALVIAWPVAVSLVVLQVWRRLGWRVTRDAVIRRNGFIGVGVDACLIRKVQRATVQQSLLQRRRGLASLELSLANGTITLPYLDIELARQLQDYILYRVESSRRSWH